MRAEAASTELNSTDVRCLGMAQISPEYCECGTKLQPWNLPRQQEASEVGLVYFEVWAWFYLCVKDVAGIRTTQKPPSSICLFVSSTFLALVAL